MLFSELQVGDSVKVIGFNPGNRAYRQSLLSMGLTKGTIFKVMRKAPCGDPLQIKVRGFSLSLRKKEADILLLEKS